MLNSIEFLLNLLFPSVMRMGDRVRNAAFIPVLKAFKNLPVMSDHHGFLFLVLYGTNDGFLKNTVYTFHKPYEELVLTGIYHAKMELII